MKNFPISIKHLAVPALAALCAAGISAADSPATDPSDSYGVYVDNHGRMRRDDNRQEVRYYGTNYTLPFAHAYRAVGAQGIDRKDAIDRDTYHIARMGANAFRLHLWDVELSDSVGNLLNNDHLDLLDYLISQMERRGIRVILTAQTNFGNGYPEHNVDTGAYSYRYEKCKVHEAPGAIAAQRRYLDQLVRHVNPYTGRSYAADKMIIAIEINNEPCHTSTPRQVKDYINDMARTIRKAGWKKPVVYNVSHNRDMVSGYYDADIDGTTYQWYPIGLVAGHERKGNFLPYVERYDIPWHNLKGYGDKARIVYEFDPADMLESYLYPAVARTFARNGFQWATQFAYDPIDLARYNTEYQTHYLNLAYTPQKALGMKIAAKTMAATPNRPDATLADTLTVDYHHNLAAWNTPEAFIYTNTTDLQPVAADSLREIAGFGSSPLVKYPGRGAYLLDKIADGVWRLEVMPDVVYSSDPFRRPSLRREVAHIIPATHPMSVNLPGLGKDFFIQPIVDRNGKEVFTSATRAQETTFEVNPGVYLLGADESILKATDRNAMTGNIRINEYVPAPVKELPTHVSHQPSPLTSKGKQLKVKAEAWSGQGIDSLVIIPASASFWATVNPTWKMNPTGPYTYEVEIPTESVGDKEFSYRIVAYTGEAPDGHGVETAKPAITFPGAIAGAPLDWDAEQEMPLYTTTVYNPGDAISLIDPSRGMDGADVSTIPYTWGRTAVEPLHRTPTQADALEITTHEGSDTVTAVITKFIGPMLGEVGGNARKLCLRFGNAGKQTTGQGAGAVTVAVVDNDGVTYSAPVDVRPGATVEIPLSELIQTPTLLVPAPYPTFLARTYTFPLAHTLNPSDIEKVQLTVTALPSASPTTTLLEGIWLQ